MYIFNLYDGDGDKDSDGDGVLDMVACKRMIKQIHGDVTPQHTSQEADRYSEEEGGTAVDSVA